MQRIKTPDDLNDTTERFQRRSLERDADLARAHKDFAPRFYYRKIFTAVALLAVAIWWGLL